MPDSRDAVYKSPLRVNHELHRAKTLGRSLFACHNHCNLR
jgi:hypothetical protein